MEQDLKKEVLDVRAVELIFNQMENGIPLEFPIVFRPDKEINHSVRHFIFHLFGTKATRKFLEEESQLNEVWVFSRPFIT